MIKLFSRGIRRIQNLPLFLKDECARYGALEGFEAVPGSKGSETFPDAVAGWGHKPTAERARAYAKEHGLPYIALEDAFYRSLRLGAEGSQPLGITVDPVGVYYDAVEPSQLELWLQDWSSWFTQAVRREAEEALRIIRSNDLSKYNAAPTFTVQHAKTFRERYNVPEGKRLILVVDQTYGDSSVTLGGADEQDFADMLSAARQEENAVVFVKTHPDVLAGKKKGYLGTVPEGVRLIAENWAPLSFMSAFDVVYTVTSQMGFEALLAGKTVHVFGVPFYAGWGLTVDHYDRETEARKAFHRRTATPSVKALFAAATMKLSRYANPITRQPCSLREALTILAAQRTANERNRGSYVAIAFRRWKQPHVRAFLSSTDNALEFVWDIDEGLKTAQAKNATAVIWSARCTDEVVAKAESMGVPVLRMEDGFLRSVGLGSDYHYPYSLVLDAHGIYYDPKRTSDIEWILRSIRERSDLADLTTRAAALRALIVRNNLSKYNVEKIVTPAWLNEVPRDRRVILVPGQVDDDASVRRGGGDIQSNRQLLETVRKANPDAYILYKPHPDVESGNRIGKIPDDVLATLADRVVRDGSLNAMWPMIDELHTLTSLSGFEALLRGKAVTTYGRPFYAGYGLTTDRLMEPRVSEPLTLDELVAGTLLLYPRYWDWQTQQFCRPEDVCHRLLHREQMDVDLWIKFCRVFRDFKNFIAEHL